MFYVYVHTVPNGKLYIGYTKDAQHRWRNGEGYLDNKRFYADIKKYGWENIKHEIVATYNSQEDASQLESALIVLLKSEDPNHGYNQTTILDDAMRKYSERVRVDTPEKGEKIEEENFFEGSGLPRKACEEMIEQWIFNKVHREMMKDRLLDGMKYPDLSKKYGKSDRQIKNIIYEGCRRLECKM